MSKLLPPCRSWMPFYVLNSCTRASLQSGVHCQKPKLYITANAYFDVFSALPFHSTLPRQTHLVTDSLPPPPPLAFGTFCAQTLQALTRLFPSYIALESTFTLVCTVQHAAFCHMHSMLIPVIVALVVSVINESFCCTKIEQKS